MSNAPNPVGNLQNKYECPVYFEQLGSSNIYTLNCGHSFSSGIVNDVASKSIKACPLCREDITIPPARNWSLEESMKDISSLQEYSQLTEQKAAGLSQSLQQANSKIFNLEKSLANANKEIEVLRSENTDLKNQLVASESRVNKLADMVELLAADNKKKTEEHDNYKKNTETRFAELEKKFTSFSQTGQQTQVATTTQKAQEEPNNRSECICTKIGRFVSNKISKVLE